MRVVIGRECENTRRLIDLLERRATVLQWGDLEEAAAETGGGVVDLLRWKLATMEQGLEA